MFTDTYDGPLIGREAEQEMLSRLVEDVRAHQSRVIVLSGEAGVGKSSLLRHVATAVAGCRVIRAAGAEAEVDLTYASLHQLCAPLMDRLVTLPAPQRDALETAFGIASGTSADRFLVGLAVLGLLADAASHDPVFCLIDDAQWLDVASAQVIAFAARRLLAEPVAVVVAARPSVNNNLFDGLPTRVIQGLTDADARRLLARSIPGRFDERVRERLIAESGGNPLALLELPRARYAVGLGGGYDGVDPGPVARRIEQSYLQQVETLPANARQLLLVAAAEPLGDPMLLHRAAQHLGLGPDAYDPLSASRLVGFADRVTFRHPLLRSAVYRSADASSRQEVHRALAAATDPATDPERRVWHRARATQAPDAAVADELEHSAERARSRGGAAAAAAFLERSMELTVDPGLRATRAMAAAAANLDAADSEAAGRLLVVAEGGPLRARDAAAAARLRAHIAFAHGRGHDSVALLLDAARKLERFDRELAYETYLEALGATMFAGRLGTSVTQREVARYARGALREAPSDRPIDLLLDGIVTFVLDGRGLGVPVLRRAVAAFQDEELSRQRHVERWLSFACPIAQELAVHQLWDFDAWEQLAERSVQLARDTGALSFLPTALMYLAGARLHAGDTRAAEAMISEGDAITAATGFVPVHYASLALAGWKGNETRALQLVAADTHDAIGRGEGIVVTIAGYAQAVLYNGLGRYQEAMESAQESIQDDSFGFVDWTLIELVEAAVRCNDPSVGTAAYERLTDRADDSDSDWALGMIARSRALITNGDRAETHYREAVERLGRSQVAIHTARAHLLYGEWLRRANRRVDARVQLRTAWDLLTAFRIDAFAERARRELLATGETVRPRTATARESLTAQEAQIAQLATEGFSNSEIGGQLFISPRTVEYHLAKVFTKLGIGSRRDIERALSADSTTPPNR